MANVERTKVIFPEPVAVAHEYGKLMRCKVSNGWICFTAHQGPKTAFFLPDADHSWNPPEIEASGVIRLDKHETNLEQELEILMLLNVASNAANRDTQRAMIAAAISAVKTGEQDAFQKAWAK